jgi:hypothetical protein
MFSAPGEVDDRTGLFLVGDDRLGVEALGVIDAALRIGDGHDLQAQQVVAQDMGELEPALP